MKNTLTPGWGPLRSSSTTIAANVTDEELEKTQALLQLYGPTLRRASRRLEEFEDECFESRRQSVSDFINLAVDYDRDTDRKRIAERLIEMGHSMQLLSMLDDALLLVKDDPKVVYSSGADA